MKVLVTGGGGFIGGAVVRRLVDRGDAVTSFARGAYPELERLGVRTLRGDLTDAAAVAAAAEGQEVVIHTAAKAGAWGPAAEYHRINVQGTRNVLGACRRHGVDRLVFTSSPSVVHTGHDIAGGTEALPYAEHFAAAYPRTKAEAERMVLAADSPELATTAIRPHLVWGPGDPHLVPRILERARRGRLALVGAGTNLIDATYIDNAAQAHLDAVDRLATATPTDRPAGGTTDRDRPPAGRAYFIAQGEPMPIRALFDMILDTAGLPPVKKQIPFPVAWALGALAETVQQIRPGHAEPLMTRFLARQLSTTHWFDLSAARSDLGYTPEVSTREGMRRLRHHLQGHR